MPQIISDDSVNALADLADMYHLVELDAVDLYTLLQRRRIDPTEASDATIQALFHHAGFLGEPVVTLPNQRLRPSDFVTGRMVAEINRRP